MPTDPRAAYRGAMNQGPLLTVDTATLVATTFALVGASVLLHYEVLKGLSILLGRTAAWHRRRILLMVFALFGLHLAEIWCFGIGYRLLLATPANGALTGPASDAGSLLDCVYFSAVIFTTLGLGDVVPSGAIRFLVGTEALAGFMLLSWSAGFTFVEMQRYWRDT